MAAARDLKDSSKNHGALVNTESLSCFHYPSFHVGRKLARGTVLASVLHTVLFSRLFVFVFNEKDAFAPLELTP